MAMVDAVPASWLATAASPKFVLRAVAAGVAVKTLVDVARSLRVAYATFGRDERLPEQQVPSRKERDAALKRGPKALEPFLAKAPDAVIIGSGIGGLACAALLARAGKRVLVLEQHDLAGGCCHTYSASGFEWDVGIHYVGEIGGGTVLRAVMDQLTRGQLKWEKQDPHYDCAYVPKSQADGLACRWDKFPMAQGLDQNEALVLERFPADAKGIRKFFRDVKLHQAGACFIIPRVLPWWLARPIAAVLDVFNGYYTRLSKTADEAFDELGIADKQLRAVLSYCWGDLGNPPASLSYGIVCGLHGHFTLHGGFFPVGGAGYIPFWIVETIRAHGGDVLVRCAVDEILLSSGRAVGVRLASGKQVMVAPGGHVVGAVGLTTLFDKLLRPSIPAVPSCVQDGGFMAPGMAAMSLFVGLEGTGEELGIDAIKENAWCYRSPDFGAFDGYLAQTPQEVIQQKTPMPGVFVGFPSTKDPSWQKDFPGKSSVTVIAFVNWAWFASHAGERVHKRSDAYNELKDAIGKQMWDFALDVYPQLGKAKVLHFEAGSPLSNNYYIGSTRGEIYGADHSNKRFALPALMQQHPDMAGIPGLKVAGQEVVCGGFSGGLYGGVLAAGDILGGPIGIWAGLISSGLRFVPNFSL